jgi:DNA helicase-2/ATP-dependent DNA helicase PcrA
VRGLLRGLDAAQRRAVTHGDGPLLVVAGPGTGKTEVVTRRIAWLIATKRAHPSAILALTFTQRAADEMQARVDSLVPYGQTDTAIHTFHAFGDRLVREHGLELGLVDTPRVIGPAEAALLLRERLFDLGLARFMPLSDPTRFLGALVDHIARAKEEGVLPAEYAAYATELRDGATVVLEGARDEGERAVAEALLDEAAAHAEIAAAYAGYESLLRERSLVDHGDQVLLAVRLLRERPALRAMLRARFRYVLVDEAQDVNPLQAELVELLCAPGGNVTFVGDDDQAIYAFRGAAVETMLALPRRYPGLRRLVLRRNHRSRGPILEAARRLVRHNDPHRLEARAGLPKALVAARRTCSDAPVRCLSFASVAEEADHIAGEIAARLEAGERADGFAVLVRTNADARPLLQSLRARGVPARTSGSDGLLEHREVRDVLSLLRAIAAPDGDTDCYAALASEAYGLGGEDMTSLLALARSRHRSLWAICRDVTAGTLEAGLSESGRATVERFVADLRASITAAHERPAGTVLYRHLRASRWLARLLARAEGGDEGPLRRVARVFDILHEVSSFATDARLAVVGAQLHTLVAGVEDPEGGADESEDAVAVLTVHQAKGLEFSVVYVAGLSDLRFPLRARPARLAFPWALRRALDGDAPPDEELAEERRLMFVAMTRARDELVLSHAVRSTPTGRRRRPSPFLAEALDRPVPSVGQDELATRLGRALEGPMVDDAGLNPGARRSAGHGASALSLSFSQIDDYLACPLRYRLRHLLRVPTPPHHALVVGEALHGALATFYRTAAQGRPVDDSLVLASLEAGWRGIGFLSRAHEEARYAAARDAVVRFVARERTAGTRRIVAVERPFSVRLGRDTVRGRYDLVTEEQAGILITDHKSSDVREGRRATERARDSLQLQVYALAWQAETGKLPAGMALHFVESGLLGRIAPAESHLARARERVAQAADGIRAARFEATPGLMACTYCPFREICPEAGTGSGRGLP